MRLLSYFLATLGLLALATVAVTLSSDPYRLYAQEFDEQEQVDLFWYLRLHKPYQIEKTKPGALVLGSSISGRLLPGAVFGEGSVSYNAALPGATFAEMQRLVEHTRTFNPLRAVVLGVEFYMFDSALPVFNESYVDERYRHADPSFPQTWRHWTQHTEDTWMSLFSRGALYLSWQQFRGINHSNRRLSPDGTWSVGAADLPAKVAFKLMAKQKFDEFYPASRTAHYTGLENLIEEIDPGATDLAILISPYHAHTLQAIASAGKLEEYYDWQKRIVSIADKYRVPVYGLESNRALVTAAINRPGNQYWDGLHYKKSTGRAISTCLRARAASCGPNDSLVLQALTAENVDAYLHSVDSNLQHYKNKHRAESGKLEALVEKWRMRTQRAGESSENQALDGGARSTPEN